MLDVYYKLIVQTRLSIRFSFNLSSSNQYHKCNLSNGHLEDVTLYSKFGSVVYT